MGRDFDLIRQRSNLTPQRAKNTVNDLPVVSRFWRMETFLPNTSVLLNVLRKTDHHEEGLDRYLDTSIRESEKFAHIIEQTNTQKSRLPRESSLK